MQLEADVAHLAKLLGGDAQLGVDFVNHGTRAARALIVHRGDFLFPAGRGIFLEDDDLGVLPAQLDHRTALRVELLHGQRNGIHFLHEFRADQRRDAAPAAACNEDTCKAVGDSYFALHPFQEFENLLRLLGIVALIIPPEDLVIGGIHDHRFNRGRADIQAHHESHALIQLRRHRLNYRRRDHRRRLGQIRQGDECAAGIAGVSSSAASARAAHGFSGA